MHVKREYFINVGGREDKVKVELEEKESFYEVVIDDNKYAVDFAQLNEVDYSIIIDGKSYAVEMSEKGGNKYEVIVDGENFNVEILN